MSEIDDKRFFNVEKAESTHTSYWSRIGCAKCMIIYAYSCYMNWVDLPFIIKNSK